jgi:hypothetical protein
MNPLLYSHLLNDNQGNQAQTRTDQKWNPIVNHPEQSANKRKKDCGDVVDGVARGHAGSDVHGIRYLLKIGQYPHREIEKEVIQDIQEGQ